MVALQQYSEKPQMQIYLSYKGKTINLDVGHYIREKM